MRCLSFAKNQLTMSSVDNKNQDNDDNDNDSVYSVGETQQEEKKGHQPSCGVCNRNIVEHGPAGERVWHDQNSTTYYNETVCGICSGSGIMICDYCATHSRLLHRCVPGDILLCPRCKRDGCEWC
jgi:hypothetical protein